MSEQSQTLNCALPACKDSLNAAHEWLASALAQLELSKDEFNRIDLAVNEWLTNIILHGKGIDGPDSVIRMRMTFGSRQVTLEIRDTYAPFNPKSMELPGHPQDLEHASSIGFGIAVILDSVSTIEYDRVDSENRLLMQFDLA